MPLLVDEDADAAQPRSDPFQLSSKAAWRLGPVRAVDAGKVSQLAEQREIGPLPGRLPGHENLQGIGHAKGFEAAVNAFGNGAGVQLRKVPGGLAQCQADGLTKQLVVGHAVLVSELYVRQFCECRRKQIEQAGEDGWVVLLPFGFEGLLILPVAGRDGRCLDADYTLDQVGLRSDRVDAVDHDRALGFEHVLFTVGVELACRESAAGGQGTEGILLLGREIRQVLEADDMAVGGADIDVFDGLGATPQRHLVGIDQVPQTALVGAFGAALFPGLFKDRVGGIRAQAVEQPGECQQPAIVRDIGMLPEFCDCRPRPPARGGGACSWCA